MSHYQILKFQLDWTFIYYFTNVLIVYSSLKSIIDFIFNAILFKHI